MVLNSRLFADVETRSNGVRLRTLIYLRWLAVLGQTVALIVATNYLGVVVPLDLCFLLIGLSALFNIGATMVWPVNQRLNMREATLTLLFDICQLSALLYLSGGLINPFAVLILAQTIIAASVLSLGATVILGAISLILVSILAVAHLPLELEGGVVIQTPRILIFGSWAALSISIVFLGVYARRVTEETYSMSEALTATQLALEREQKLTALGGVVAAAAHELGTPLATIMLVSGELRDEIGDDPHLIEDVELIREQAARCREILHSMGRSGKDDLHLRHAPFEAVVTEAAEPHMNRGKRVVLRVRGRPAEELIGGQPLISRRSEVVHGVRNLVQNAVDFAHSAVWIDLDWSDERLMLKVGDDGRGYPPDMLGRIGDPFLRRRASVARTYPQQERPNYTGMGLGLFIAKTLLERTGAKLTFANGVRGGPGTGPIASSTPSGAIVEVIWNRESLEVDAAQARGALGENVPMAT